MSELIFHGKKDTIKYYQALEAGSLEIDKNKSNNLDLTIDFPYDHNLIIHSDNVKALKTLLKYYKNRIDCIYIDPPYNVGDTFKIYEDKEFDLPFEISSADRHDKWLCMMYPRLQLLKQLLSDEGVILISIDDNEVHRLKCLMDEIFGSCDPFPNGNFLGQIIWSNKSVRNVSRFLSNAHDYIVCYSKNYDAIKKKKVKWRVEKQGISRIFEKHEELKSKHKDDFEKISNELKKWFRALDGTDIAKKHADYCFVDERGVYASFASGAAHKAMGNSFEVLHPETGKPCKLPGRGFRFAEKRFRELLSENRIKFGKDERTVPRRKGYLHEVNKEVMSNIIWQDRQGSTRRMEDILGIDFSYPKDERVIQRLLGAITSNDAIILDAFAGSGTTGHAVLNLNKSDPESNRRFILIEKEEYADEITAERIRRVISGIDTAKEKDLREGTGGSFTFCKISDDYEKDRKLERSNEPI